MKHKCGFPSAIITILSNIQELTLGKIFKYYKLDGAGFDKIMNGVKIFGQKNPALDFKHSDDEDEDGDEDGDEDEN